MEAGMTAIAGGRDERFFASTRGQVAMLLRHGDRTVEELAQALGLTDNAVRAHLATLERDGLVRQAGLRRGTSKPAYAYGLTPAAERLFPKAYGTLLRLLLDVLAERLPPSAVDDALRDVGHRVAAAQAVPIGELRDRVDQALAVLADLGGLAEAEEREDGFIIRGASCPLAAAIPGHPEVCLLAETLLSDVIGVPVAECCERGEQPRCCFAVPAPTAAGASPG
jgi:predicted ArsR family transcriptional regulator